MMKRKVDPTIQRRSKRMQGLSPDVATEVADSQPIIEDEPLDQLGEEPLEHADEETRQNNEEVPAELHEEISQNNGEEA